MPEGRTADIAIDASIGASVARKGDLKIEKEDLVSRGLFQLRISCH